MKYVLKDKKTGLLDLNNEYTLEQLIDVARNYEFNTYSEREAIDVLSKNGYDVYGTD